ncbi:RNA helicase [Guyanagaster necrorhizus]|uniref:RNA helicase n=1 Tax=Guyanagaster necrorhizus TaxID=856835 RepID=A0A9P7VIJ1_9AGAR|nr:RNA helicase [Guyanagaster necrorhizus MCA 3950]KAG7441339.1 RNA helicase [Guyanagaster necrorhizus MCA 3950]
MAVGWCYDSVSPDGCKRSPGTCQLRHDITKCSCGLVLDICNYEPHIHGKRHQHIVAGTQRPVSKRGKAGPKLKQCPHCSPSREFLENELEAHVVTHTVQERLATTLNEAQRNKNGIEVSNLTGLDFGIVDEDEQLPVVVEMLVQRTSGDDSGAPISLTKLRMLSSQRQDEHGVKFSVTITPASKFIRSARPHKVSVTFHPSYAGRFEDTLELVFINIVKRHRFVIQRQVFATVGCRADHEHLAPKAPYTRRKRRNIKLDGPIKRSLRPPTWTPTKFSKLPQFNVPKNLIQAVYTEKGYVKRSAKQDVKRFMPSSFTISKYAQHFQTMLYLEEEQKKQDLDAYSMEGVEIKADYPRYKLKVEGLSEGRPSVLIGDYILVRPVGQPDKAWFEGRVHNVAMEHVSLRFSDDFNTYRGTKFDVRFVLNRLPCRRAHQALVNKNDLARLLFPGPEHLISARPVSRDVLKELVPFNRSLGNNPEQLETVAAIVHQPRGSVPFIVFGPPGTGKTVTIVEAMRQILQRHPDAHILACTPSNESADLIAQGLMHLGPMNIFRLNAMSRKLSRLPLTLQPYSLINGNGTFAMPILEDVLRRRVVVCTCISAGALTGLGVKRGHFGWIFIDEAGQATEPDTMVPIKGLADEYTNVILAGDPEQLTPTVTSRLARDLGLVESYLVRLMKRPCYGLEPWNANGSGGGWGVTVVELLQNFRSHPGILAFSNAQFYRNRLRACGDPMLTRSFENWDELPTKKFPIIFHAVVGRDQREKSSPSYFNIDEATLVKKYCLRLVEKKGTRAEHIAIITPYHAQKMKILELFRKDHKLKDVSVGSVEEFQGQERRIVIISTVRSNSDFIASDIRRSLGFVASPRRFNVAMTRAQALLIIVGNSDVLALDPVWRSFMNYVHDHGGWRGHRMSWDPLDNVNDYVEHVKRRAAGEAEETLTRLKALVVGVSEAGGVLPSLDSDDDDDEIDGGLGDGLVIQEVD